MKTLILPLLAVWFSAQSQAYAEEELNVLAAREHAMMRSPSALNGSKVWDRARQHQQAATELGRHIQSLAKPNALTKLLNTPPPTQNPDRAPKGVMVFVSLTMPSPSLKQLLKQSERTGVPMVIRGVLPKGFPATTARISQLIGIHRKKPIQAGFSISPEWFRRFNVERVPAFVSVKAGRCLLKQACNPKDYDIVYGNLSLYQALEVLTQGDTGENARELLKRLEQ
ncbi:type-F conjugative transfer system pilin assembly protein TrbC [Vibrio tubiashii]|uniref:type-F conjugative transfer system pilin assembly protein TrbC n=1 Tax=Vibrio tubiashii TaxID=29498 RepID=UPI001EFE946C|nr:type-F conjugative transfer system pilin assembly protein TrbC [Vibrio tubiashii]MCG9583758.1 type-F conjugative transfer system pilin assembly protein TrbC [Vibrio tubiashii]MCG9617336.1 type-F conjugative transfer system pilin assembly protein TrbC [Vibrio tubiashii]MCG9685770.1 type-F conjugative transfer system pilin assembly protein TrbC [Vibrio tubiashii]